MATTEEIMKAAGDLGKLIAAHATARQFTEAVQRLQADADAQRMLTDFNKTVQRLGQKQASGQPISAEDQRQIQSMQNLAARNLTIQRFQMAQMDYLDLIRKVDEAMGVNGPAGGDGGPLVEAE